MINQGQLTKGKRTLDAEVNSIFNDTFTLIDNKYSELKDQSDLFFWDIGSILHKLKDISEYQFKETLLKDHFIEISKKIDFYAEEVKSAKGIFSYLLIKRLGFDIGELSSLRNKYNYSLIETEEKFNYSLDCLFDESRTVNYEIKKNIDKGLRYKTYTFIGFVKMITDKANLEIKEVYDNMIPKVKKKFNLFLSILNGLESKVNDFVTFFTDKYKFNYLDSFHDGYDSLFFSIKRYFNTLDR